MSTELNVFLCRPNTENMVKIQLEIPKATLEAYKAKAAAEHSGRYTPKQIMEFVLNGNVEAAVDIR